MNAAMQVPSVHKRQRIPEEAIRDVTAQIVEKFRPQRILLFGSYASGKPRPESDVDLLIVMDTLLRESEQAVQIAQQIDYLFGLDLVVIRPDRLKSRMEMGDSFLIEVIQTGKVLYESPDS